MIDPAPGGLENALRAWATADENLRHSEIAKGRQRDRSSCTARE